MKSVSQKCVLVVTLWFFATVLVIVMTRMYLMPLDKLRATAFKESFKTGSSFTQDITLLFVLATNDNNVAKRIESRVMRVLNGTSNTLSYKRVIELITHKRIVLNEPIFVNQRFPIRECEDYSKRLGSLKSDIAKKPRARIDANTIIVFIDDNETRGCGKEGALAGKNSFWMPYGGFMAGNSTLFGISDEKISGASFLHELFHTLNFGHSCKQGAGASVRSDGYSIMGTAQKQFSQNQIVGLYPFSFDGAQIRNLTSPKATLDVSEITNVKQTFQINAYVMQSHDSYIAIKYKQFPNPSIFISLYQIVGIEGRPFPESNARVLVHLSENLVDTILIADIPIKGEATLPGTVYIPKELINEKGWTDSRKIVPVPRLTISFDGMLNDRVGSVSILRTK